MKTLTYTLGEKLFGYTPRPVPTGNQKLCRCGRGIVETHMHSTSSTSLGVPIETESCKACQENDTELLEALQNL